MSVQSAVRLISTNQWLFVYFPRCVNCVLKQVKAVELLAVQVIMPMGQNIKSD